MKSIKSFYFQNAKYLASDEKGNAVFMDLKYRDNAFSIEVVRSVDYDLDSLIEEATNVAKNLLKKKHNVNFVQRLEIS